MHWGVLAMSQPRWQAVDSFTDSGRLSDLERSTSVAGVSCQRFQSGGGGRALLLPRKQLEEGKVPGITVIGAPAETAELLFLDPANGTDAVSLLGALGERGRAVRVALPPESDPTGLIPDPGRITLAAGPEPVVFDLFRSADPGTLKLQRQAGVPKLGEDADVLEQRSKWFQAREGRSE
jgi:hypothetical protein